MLSCIVNYKVIKLKTKERDEIMNNDYRYFPLAKQMYERIEKTLTAENKNKDQLITLKEIREILKENRELLWYYPIYNDNGMFYLQGMKTLSSSYLHLETSNPYLPEDICVYFDMDIENTGMSINTRNDYLYLKIQRLLRNQYLEHNPWIRPHSIPILSEPLNQLTFPRSQFNQMEKELRKIRKRN